MDLIKIQDSELKTMSSREIAELTGKNHADVMRDIRNLQEQLAESNFALWCKDSEYKAETGQSYKMYLLDKESTLTLISGYSAPLRMAIIKRWQELESKQPKELTTLEILTLALESEKKRIEAEKTVAILTHVNKTYTMTEIAKELYLKSANELNKILKDKGVQYKMNDTWVLYSKYSNLGYFDIKQEVLDNGKVVYHRRVTQIGREFIIKLLSK